MKDDKKVFLVVLALVLVVILILVNLFYTPKEGSSSVVYVGYKTVGEDTYELNPLQKSACENAQKNDNCDKIDQTFIVTEDVCCAKMDVCCR